MKPLVAGYRYQLQSLDGTNQQVLQFIHKAPNGVGEFLTVEDGTTNEEVLAVLIDRLEFLNAKMPGPENEQAIVYAKQCLAELNKRTQARIARGVEGTPKP